MRKIIFGLLLIMTALYAELWNSVCTSQQIKQFDDTRYIPFGTTNYSTLMFDKKTISIDKKNKIIRVWISELATPNGRKYQIETFGQYADFSKYGYQRHLWKINYKNRLYGIAEGVSYTCDRDAIKSYDAIDDKDVPMMRIAPQTQPEVIMESIMKIYNLK